MSDTPLLYYRTREQMIAYRNKPVLEKLQQLQAWMMFLHAAMPEKSKQFRDKMKGKAIVT